MEKVYCKNCKFYDNSYSDYGVRPKCIATNNLKDDYEAPKCVRILTPSEKNKINNCKDYQEKTKYHRIISICNLFTNKSDDFIK